ncbi:MAG TPA: transglycosylase SLT domain-containing protein [Burkholderiaceae bacterium]|nr:transglycosylase SLT domain-containing protein [Burkholderiaceae bacterium]
MQRFLHSARVVATRTRTRLPLVLGAILLGAGCSTLSPSDEPASKAGALAEPVAATPAQAAEPAATAVAGYGTDDSRPKWTGRDEAAAPGDLWERIRNGFAMPELDTTLVAEKERFYLSKPDYLQRMFERGGRYLFHIVEEIEKRGMPTELALLPFVESAMNPVALSHAQAAGLWQFIPSTGRAYNLDQNWWVDNRRDVVKSTQAALEYLQKIYAMHGDDWFLALASYNWGEGAVGRAIRNNKARGLPADYLSLRMPAETRHYVPKLIALKHIVLRADALGVALPELPNQPYFVTIEKTRPIDLELAARFAGMTVKEFVALNPAHNRPVISASRNSQIKLPADRVDAFIDAVERHGRENRAFATWQPYTMKSGDTLESLARRGGITVAALREANGLKAGRKILAGTRILSPHLGAIDGVAIEDFDGPRVYELVERPAVYHLVRPRDSLTSIARRYGTTVASLRELNGLKKAVAPRGARLLVRQASVQTMLTNENGQRRVVAQSDEPRVMRAVLREEVVAPAAARPAVAERAEPRPAARPKKPAANTARAARSRSGSRAAAAPKAAAPKTTAKTPVGRSEARPAAKSGARPATQRKQPAAAPLRTGGKPAAPAQRAGKRT